METTKEVRMVAKAGYLVHYGPGWTRLRLFKQSMKKTVLLWQIDLKFSCIATCYKAGGCTLLPIAQ